VAQGVWGSLTCGLTRTTPGLGALTSLFSARLFRRAPRPKLARHMYGCLECGLRRGARGLMTRWASCHRCAFGEGGGEVGEAGCPAAPIAQRRRWLLPGTGAGVASCTCGICARAPEGRCSQRREIGLGLTRRRGVALGVYAWAPPEPTTLSVSNCSPRANPPPARRPRSARRSRSPPPEFNAQRTTSATRR
jgi:hypothetical protein